MRLLLSMAESATTEALVRPISFDRYDYEGKTYSANSGELELLAAILQDQDLVSVYTRSSAKFTTKGFIAAEEAGAERKRSVQGFVAMPFSTAF